MFRPSHIDYKVPRPRLRPRPHPRPRSVSRLNPPRQHPLLARATKPTAGASDGSRSTIRAAGVRRSINRMHPAMRQGLSPFRPLPALPIRAPRPQSQARPLPCRWLTTSSSNGTNRGSACNHFVDSGKVEPTSSPPSRLPGSKPFRLAVKDNIAAAGFPTQCASRILLGHASPFEATIVRQLRARGADVVGKTNMDEFGMGSHSTNSIHGPVHNPLSPDGEPLSAGGSSGGSAVAVLLGDADLALGTDTGGSVRLPASYTGTVGYRPSYGMISRYGVFPYANSLDTVGFIARDVQPMLDLLVKTKLDEEHDPQDPTSLSVATRRRCATACPPTLQDNAQLTVGIPLEYNIAELDPVIRRSWVAAASALEAQGVKIVPVSLPSTKEALCAYYVIAVAEASSNLAKYDGVRYGVRAPGSDAAGDTLYSETRGSGFGDEVKRRILLGTYTLSSKAMDNYFIQAQKVRRLIRRDFDRVFRLANPLQDPEQFDLSDMAEATGLEDKRGPPQVDFLLSPTTPSFAPKLRDVLENSSTDAYMNDVFTVPASLAGLPAMSLPARTKESHLPVGLQLIAQFWDDKRLLAMAERLKELVYRSAGERGGLGT
ncbi:Trimeric GatFAB AmidoTransferase(AdT) complex subunit [Purpureocillium takamizusanense]|uniref:Glutamyl-tRNA(Gln) amidotransferase subunit A, mitochondrial n=1 Tax=Purpureocillium takamizusanense TaxID=2060973 RepID=A0A9Q8Q6Y1_9HYPO|nr:Trimeric GatFAB AmidoTransferase(AdT) complex subunit [Purpureocillium takamizusanense]UNI13664.1 Trimeric GatFAB AmidoTransferase(AdT) complex subunit [Purpureocillium takamizusanense]